MRVVVIGATGHVGTYMVPRLLELGHTVVAVSRSRREPYHSHAAWNCVERVVLDREAEENAGEFGRQISEIQPDVVIDMICFRLESAHALVEALRGQVQHFLHCGTIWVHGHGTELPVTEDAPRRPFGEYGCRKAAIEAWLLGEARRSGFPATIIHPGHIVGEGWPPLNPAGNFNPQVFTDLAKGNELKLPNLGLETVHHVHADDVAQGFLCAMRNRAAAVGESFHIVSPAALSLRGYAERMASWFGTEAKLRYLPWEEWRTTVSEADAAATWDHIAHSPNASIAKAERMIGYRPRYRSLEAVQESVGWLIRNQRIEV